MADCVICEEQTQGVYYYPVVDENGIIHHKKLPICRFCMDMMIKETWRTECVESIKKYLKN